MIAAFTFAAFSSNVMGKFEAFGLGTVTGGLIGLLRGPASAAPSVTATTEGPGSATISSAGAAEPAQASGENDHG
jgi:hypothetical protein